MIGGKERWQILSTSTGGLQRTWSRIKSYLNTWIASWKTTNFGSGTYNNSGNFTIDESIDFGVHTLHFGTKAFSVSANNAALGVAITSYQGIAMSRYTSAIGTLVLNQTDKNLIILVIAADNNGNVYAGSESISAGSSSSIKVKSSSASANGNCLIIWYGNAT